ncbi:hypothetical protein [Paenibacillus sp. HB172176]|nr:hypothetical protein [Paenibacillus sp. HB172176]
MREYVGTCSLCGKSIYCEDGFLNGIVLEDKELLCFECRESAKAKKPR